MKAVVLATLLALAAYAAPQAPADPEIRGVVVEPGVNLPVAGATVELSVQTTSSVKINGGWLPDKRKATTDERGRFSLTLDKPGPYRVEARKDGYLDPGRDGPPAYAEVKLTADHPVADVKLSLVPPTALTGTAINDDTGKPLAGVRVRQMTDLSDVLETFADIGDLMRDAGFAPSTPIEEGIRGFVAWYREHYRIERR